MTYEERVKACLKDHYLIEQVEELVKLLFEVKREGYDEGYQEACWEALNER